MVGKVSRDLPHVVASIDPLDSGVTLGTSDPLVLFFKKLDDLLERSILRTWLTTMCFCFAAFTSDLLAERTNSFHSQNRSGWNECPTSRIVAVDSIIGLPLYCFECKEVQHGVIDEAADKFDRNDAAALWRVSRLASYCGFEHP